MVQTVSMQRMHKLAGFSVVVHNHLVMVPLWTQLPFRSCQRVHLCLAGVGLCTYPSEGHWTRALAFASSLCHCVVNESDAQSAL